jgi:pyrimidine-nucleoside phosphorylase
MRAVDIIRRKRDGHELTAAEIGAFVAAAARNSWPEYQLAALLMAIVWRGMTPSETADLTLAMTNSGKRLDLSDLPGAKIDKHSTGGVGDKTSLILAPLAAACGVTVPMMSGRGLGHTGGTLDKLEAIPGFRVNLSEAEFRAALAAVRIGMIGQTHDIAPADKTLYALRDVTATVECVPLITASILSKKLAEGINGLVLDVKCGRGAFMKTRADANTLAESLVRVAKLNGLPCEALITAMDAPLGCAIGNANEVVECIETLKGRGPDDLTELSVLLAARMVRLAGIADAEPLVRRALASGAGVECFRRMVAQQGGDPRVVDDYSCLPSAPHELTITAEANGVLHALDAEAIGVASMRLGGGRMRAEDVIDPGVGVKLLAKPGESVRFGQPLFVVRYRKGELLADSVNLLKTAFTLSDEPFTHRPLVWEQLS